MCASSYWCAIATFGILSGLPAIALNSHVHPHYGRWGGFALAFHTVALPAAVSAIVFAVSLFSLKLRIGIMRAFCLGVASALVAILVLFSIGELLISLIALIVGGFGSPFAYAHLATPYRMRNFKP
jgi:hypothetical protein